MQRRHSRYNRAAENVAHHPRSFARRRPQVLRPRLLQFVEFRKWPTRMHPASPNSIRRGVSLLELVIVILIIGILSAVAIPRYSQSLDHAHVRMAARRIIADFALARQRALTTSTPVEISFDALTSSYSLSNTTDLNNSGTPYSVQLVKSPYKAQLASVDFDGDSAVQFDHYGQPGSGGTVVVTVGSHQLTIALDPLTGQGSIQ